MEEQGKLLREQNLMAAAPAASRGEFNPISPVPRFRPSTLLPYSSGTFGLATSINMYGNFPQFITCPYHEQYLSRSIDEYGTLLVMRGMPVMRGTSSTVRSKLDCSTSVPKLLQHESDQVLPGSTSVPKLLQHESDQVLPGLTSVPSLLQHESDQVLPNQVLPDENTATHVEHLLRPIVQTTANNVDRQTSPGFDEIMPS
jgi:hypothetical protein